MNDKEKTINKYSNNLVVKSNELNSMYYKLDIRAQKLICIFISLIDSRDRKNINNYYVITIRELVELLEIEDSNSAKREILNTCRALNDKNLLYLGNNEYSTWISSLKFTFDGTIEFEFSKRLIPHLFNLKEKFTSYRLGNVQPMKTLKSIRIYELLKQHEHKGNLSIELEQLRGLLGIEAGSYKNFNDFKKRILETAQVEIKTFTDLQFYFTTENVPKTKKVAKILFKIIPSDIDLNKWSEKLKEINAFKRGRKKIYEAPNSNFHTPNYINVYKNFIEQIDNFPENFSFEQYLKDRDFVIITQAGKKDIVPDQKFQF